MFRAEQEDTKMRVLCIFREPECSYQALHEDRAVLEAVGQSLSGSQASVSYCEANEILEHLRKWDLIFAMCQSPRNIEWLKLLEGSVQIINPPVAMLNCHRQQMLLNLARYGFQHPTWELREIATLRYQDSSGRWIKRPDLHATSGQDVLCVGSEDQLETCRRHFLHNRISEVIVQDHVEGSVVKCYAVAESFFHFEVKSQLAPWDLWFIEERTREMTFQIGQCLGLVVYGVEFIVTKDGQVYIIDVNDWPSFRTCVNEAADAIVRCATIRG